MAKEVVTSTIEMGRVTLFAKTELEPIQFTRTDFMEALKKVSRKRTKKSAPDQASTGTSESQFTRSGNEPSNESPSDAAGEP